MTCGQESQTSWSPSRELQTNDPARRQCPCRLRLLSSVFFHSFEMSWNVWKCLEIQSKTKCSSNCFKWFNFLASPLSPGLSSWDFIKLCHTEAFCSSCCNKLLAVSTSSELNYSKMTKALQPHALHALHALHVPHVPISKAPPLQPLHLLPLGVMLPKPPFLGCRLPQILRLLGTHMSFFKAIKYDQAVQAAKQTSFITTLKRSSDLTETSDGNDLPALFCQDLPGQCSSNDKETKYTASCSFGSAKFKYTLALNVISNCKDFPTSKLYMWPSARMFGELNMYLIWLTINVDNSFSFPSSPCHFCLLRRQATAICLGETWHSTLLMSTIEDDVYRRKAKQKHS